MTVSRRRALAAYAALVVIPLLALLVILEWGRTLPSPYGAAAPASGAFVPASMALLKLPVFLVQITVIIAASRLVGLVLRRFGQPQVVGEMLAGLMLGPSLLGLALPAAYAWLFPAGTVRFLNALSQIGLVLFMFLMGLELNLREIAARGRHVAVTAHASIAVPMLCGGVLALFLYGRFATVGTPFPAFGLFIGCALSVTAFPVLARILTARGLSATSFGSMAMACAAIADVSAWVILAFVVGLVRGGSATAVGTLGWTLVETLAYLILMLWVVRPALARLWHARVTRRPENAGDPTADDLSAVLLVVLLSAVATEYLHIHALFGAFLAGVVMPSDARLRGAIEARFEDLLSVLLLPLFFAYAGLRTNVGALTTTADWVACGAVIAVAVASKLGGGMLAARAMGSSWRSSGALGILMNARGLMELVLLTIGLQVGIITTGLYTVMVLMALATTLMTTPLLALVLRETRTRPG